MHTLLLACSPEVFPPDKLARKVLEVLRAEPMRDAVLIAPHAAVPCLSHVVVDALTRGVLLGVLNGMVLSDRTHAVVRRALIRHHNRVSSDKSSGHCHHARVIFVRANKRHHPLGALTYLTCLAERDHYALVSPLQPIAMCRSCGDPRLSRVAGCLLAIPDLQCVFRHLRSAIRPARFAAQVDPVHMDDAAERREIHAIGQHLPNLAKVRLNGLGRTAGRPRCFQQGLPLGRGLEVQQHVQDLPVRELARMESGATGDAEFMRAVGAPPPAPGFTPMVPTEHAARRTRLLGLAAPAKQREERFGLVFREISAFPHVVAGCG